jgi:two-component system, NarL family, sensor histidine kinase UhpB
MPRAQGGEAPRPRWLAAALRVPLFYKILLANAAIVLAAVTAGSALTGSFVRGAPERSTADLVVVIALAGVAVSVVVNAVILRLALGPIRELEAAAARVQAGDLEARAPLSPLADRELERLIRTFNRTVDSLLAYRGRLRAIARRALGAGEEERRRISRELHDETAQGLAALLVRLRIARAAPEEERDRHLEEMRREIGNALEGVRRFARGLRPPALDELGLFPALESFTRSVQEVSEATISLTGEVGEGEIDGEVELAVYRIVQEAVSNALRHSGATRIAVELARADAALHATVRDNGRGFPVPAAFTDGSGLGLFGMQERAAYVGGTVEIESEAGAGTTVTAIVPLGEPFSATA